MKTLQFTEQELDVLTSALNEYKNNSKIQMYNDSLTPAEIMNYQSDLYKVNKLINSLENQL